MTNDDKSKGIIVSVSCETDFVAKNEDFQLFVKNIASIALENLPADKEALLALPLDGSTIGDKLIDQTGKIGEKIEATAYELLEGENISSYIHAGSKIGVLVSYKDGGKEGADQFFKGMAMHIAAMSPSMLHYNQFEADYIAKETEAYQNQVKIENEERERLGKHLLNVPKYVSQTQLTEEVMAAAADVIKEELKAEGKPEKIWDKILPGKLERFVADNTLLDKEHCLLNQNYALDDSKSVETAIADFNAGASIVAFKRVAVG
ncbi:UNVERIFIED_CONTAM: hypothetical protein GTU68_017237 [Idotea baltica]|nr:hypothetical protein [Idotea baltica]